MMKRGIMKTMNLSNSVQLIIMWWPRKSMKKWVMRRKITLWNNNQSTITPGRKSFGTVTTTTISWQKYQPLRQQQKRYSPKSSSRQRRKRKNSISHLSRSNKSRLLRQINSRRRRGESWLGVPRPQAIPLPLTSISSLSSVSLLLSLSDRGRYQRHLVSIISSLGLARGLQRKGHLDR